jgi:hypothetical protein
MRVPAALLAALAASAALAAPDTEIVRAFPLPARTGGGPRAAQRAVHASGQPARTAYPRAHGGPRARAADEVDGLCPVFARDWIAEPSLYQVTTPSFDSAGNLYMTPLLPHEPIL